jgi:hypothetical protein
MVYSHRRPHTRLLKTIFGPVQITRMSYSHPGAASIHPLDEVLQLPARSFSYELQKRIVKAAVQGTFRETRERIAEITGAPVHTRSVEEVIQDAAEDFDAFYVQRDPPPWARYRLGLGGGGGLERDSDDQARGGTRARATDQGSKKKP